MIVGAMFWALPEVELCCEKKSCRFGGGKEVQIQVNSSKKGWGGLEGNLQ